jgi:hypothetical protein
MLRWVAFCAMDPSKPGERAEYHSIASESPGYTPVASGGEDEALVEDVTRVCQAFHPDTSLPAKEFASCFPVYLFWRSRAGENVLTRVSRAPDVKGLRLALDYYSVVLSEDDLCEIRWDPRVLMDGKVHNRVQELHSRGRRDPAEFAPRLQDPGITLDPAMDPAPDTDPMPLSGEYPRTDENYNDLMAFLTSRARRTHSAPPTFATWWSSARPVPLDTFEIVLRSADASRPPAPKELIETAFGLAREVKSSLPSPPADDLLARKTCDSILRYADDVARLLDNVYRNLYTLSRTKWEERVQRAAAESRKISNDLTALAGRLGESAGPGTDSVLEGLASRYEVFSDRLANLRHPNPFPGRSPQAVWRTDDSERRKFWFPSFRRRVNTASLERSTDIDEQSPATIPVVDSQGVHGRSRSRHLSHLILGGIALLALIFAGAIYATYRLTVNSVRPSLETGSVRTRRFAGPGNDPTRIAQDLEARKLARQQAGDGAYRRARTLQRPLKDRESESMARVALRSAFRQVTGQDSLQYASLRTMIETTNAAYAASDRYRLEQANTARERTGPD